jgi:hypothetical protein
MTIDVPDFTHLTAAQFFVILVGVALLDWATGVIGALRGHAFDLQLVLDVLQTHGIAKILPIGATFAVGWFAVIPALCFIADGFLALYFAQTVQSSWTNLSPVAGPVPLPAPLPLADPTTVSDTPAP